MSTRYPQLTPAAIRRLTTNPEPWMSCDDCFEMLDDVIEQLLHSERRVQTRLVAHLHGCGACFEEAWSLLLLAAEEQGVDANQALARLKVALDSDALQWPDLSVPPSIG